MQPGQWAISDVIWRRGKIKRRTTAHSWSSQAVWKVSLPATTAPPTAPPPAQRVVHSRGFGRSDGSVISSLPEQINNFLYNFLTCPFNGTTLGLAGGRIGRGPARNGQILVFLFFAVHFNNQGTFLFSLRNSPKGTICTNDWSNNWISSFIPHHWLWGYSLLWVTSDWSQGLVSALLWVAELRNMLLMQCSQSWMISWGEWP